MPQTVVNREASSLTPSALISFFKLDLTPIGSPSVFYFVDQTSCNYQPIVFDGTTYVPFPVIIKEFGYDGQGGIVRPKLSVSNINGFVSNLLLQGQDLEGAIVTYTRVFARFIDAVNFPGGVSPYTPDPTATYAPETFTINRKTQENQAIVEWELATAFELDNRRLPSRQCLANLCSFSYRESGTCGYAGAPVTDQNGNVFSGAGLYNFTSFQAAGNWDSSTQYHRGDYVTGFSPVQSLTNIPQVFIATSANINSNPLMAGNTNWVQDGCPRTLAGCRAHFTGLSVLPFGAYPGLTRSPFIAGYNSVAS